MKERCEWRIPARVGCGLFVTALCALPQAYTISARPGAVNYVEGTVTFDGKPLPAKGSAQLFLSANDTLTTQDGKAEVLLTPGVFLRLGNNSEVKMISPHLTNTAVELTQGEAVVEVAELQQDNNIQIVDHGAGVKLEKPGLYRFSAGDTAMARVYEGKATVDANGNHFELGKGRELALVDATKVAKFKTKENEDDLYAWSKVRDEYESATSYDAANRLSRSGLLNSSLGSGYGAGYGTGFGPGLGGYGGAGWFWNSGFNSWAWLPGDGAFFSPYGYGYYSPGYVQYAPVVYLPVRGGYYAGGAGTRPVGVPVNPAKPMPVAGVKPVVPSGAMSVRQASWALSNVRANGGHVAGQAMVMQAHSPAPVASGGGGGRAGGGNGGGFAGRASAPGPAAAPAGGHSAGGAGHK